LSNLHTKEYSKEPYLLFHVVSTIQEACIREWAILTQDFIIELQNFLLNYILNFPDLEKYVQKQVFLAIAVLFKRSKLDSIFQSNISNQSSKFLNLVKNVIDLFKNDDTKLVTNLFAIRVINLPQHRFFIFKFFSKSFLVH